MLRDTAKCGRWGLEVSSRGNAAASSERQLVQLGWGGKGSREVGCPHPWRSAFWAESWLLTGSGCSSPRPRGQPERHVRRPGLGKQRSREHAECTPYTRKDGGVRLVSVKLISPYTSKLYPLPRLDRTYVGPCTAQGQVIVASRVAQSDTAEVGSMSNTT